MKFTKILLIIFFTRLIVGDAQNQSTQTSTILSSSALEITAEEQQPVTLVYQNREIVTLRAKINGVTPQQRVNKALARLEQLTDFALTESVHINRIKEGILVFVGSHFIFGIAQEDLVPSSSETVDQVGKRAVSNLQAALLAQSEQKNPKILLRGIVFSLLATFLFLIILASLFRMRAGLFNYFSRKAETSAKMHIFGLDLKNTARIVFQIILRFALFSLALVTAYGWLAFLFRQFPYTYPWGIALRSFFWNSVKGLATGFAH